jgi:hypothetical protein
VVDLRNLVALAELDWVYIEHWAAEWDVSDRLAALRSTFLL